MAWWTTQLIFQRNTLIAEGLDPLSVEDLDWIVQDELPEGTQHFTRVIVSGYALYGELRGYYALGVAHWFLDRPSGRVFLSQASQLNNEPVSSLTSAQKEVIREYLIGFNRGAWETSNTSFRMQLEI